MAVSERLFSRYSGSRRRTLGAAVGLTVGIVMGSIVASFAKQWIVASWFSGPGVMVLDLFGRVPHTRVGQGLPNTAELIWANAIAYGSFGALLLVLLELQRAARSQAPFRWRADLLPLTIAIAVTVVVSVAVVVVSREAMIGLSNLFRLENRVLGTILVVSIVSSGFLAVICSFRVVFEKARVIETGTGD